jgi:hypothetical protein
MVSVVPSTKRKTRSGIHTVDDTGEVDVAIFVVALVVVVVVVVLVVVVEPPRFEFVGMASVCAGLGVVATGPAAVGVAAGSIVMVVEGTAVIIVVGAGVGISVVPGVVVVVA